MNIHTHNKKCKACEIDFEPKRNDAKFCSDKCRNHYHKHIAPQEQAKLLEQQEQENQWQIQQAKELQVKIKKENQLNKYAKRQEQKYKTQKIKAILEYRFECKQTQINYEYAYKYERKQARLKELLLYKQTLDNQKIEIEKQKIETIENIFEKLQNDFKDFEHRYFNEYIQSPEYKAYQNRKQKEVNNVAVVIGSVIDNTLKYLGIKKNIPQKPKFKLIKK